MTFEPSNRTAASSAPAPGDPKASTPPSRSHTNAWCWVLLALFTFYLLMANRSYQIADRRPPTFDDAWYLETSLHLYYQLTHNGFSDFCSAYASSFRTKAPLISVLPIPFYLLLGTRYHSAILVEGPKDRSKLGFARFSRPRMLRTRSENPNQSALLGERPENGERGRCRSAVAAA
jgi:hypothetical protein